MRLDHVAIAAPDHRPVLRSLTGDLGGLVIGGGYPPGGGFRAMQIRLGRGDEGMTVEVLEPFETWNNDFLARFLAETGGGVHHLTFKTDDVAAARERLQAMGIEPVGVNFEGGWKEMFIHPRQAHGTVVQIAQSDYRSLPMAELLAGLPATRMNFQGEGSWWDESSVSSSRAAATLHRVVIATPDVDGGLGFYRDIMLGEASGPVVSWEGGELLLERSEGRPRVDRLEISGHPGLSVEGVRFVGP